MAVSHATAYTKARYHYARLLLAPLPPSSTPIDIPTLLQLVHKTTSEWYGTMGGPVALSDVDVVLIEPRLGANEADPAREVVIRFPAGATPALLTALPLTPSPAFRLSIIRDAADLASLGGVAGRGKSGYAAWVGGVKGLAREAREGAMQEV